MHNDRGTALFELNLFDQALASYERALGLRPRFAAALSNRGNTLRELNRLHDALASFKEALQIDSSFADAHNNLGLVLHKLNRPEEAVAAFRKALDLAPTLGDAHNNLGNVLRDLGRLDEALTSYREAVRLMPDSVEANLNFSSILHRLVPPWHMPMMNDSRRNDAYVQALSSAISEQTDVLEIGTGSGLLAMLAARLGARSVATCEAVSIIADRAREIVAANGYGSRVKVIPKFSRDIVVGIDLEQRANLLVSEVLSSELLGEGVLASIEDAKRRLIEPGAQVIPATGSIVVALAGGEGIRKNISVDQVLGFDLSGFNEIGSAKRYVHRHDLDIELLTDATDAFVFDFARGRYFPAERKRLQLPVTTSGTCYGIAQWIRLQLDAHTAFENHPSIRTPATSWQTCFYRFPAPVQVRPGQTAVVRAAHNRSAVWFFWEGVE